MYLIFEIKSAQSTFHVKRKNNRETNQSNDYQYKLPSFAHTDNYSKTVTM